MQAIWIMPVANCTGLKAVQLIQVNLWNAKYKNKTPVNTNECHTVHKQKWEHEQNALEEIQGQGYMAADCCKKMATEKTNTQANVN